VIMAGLHKWPASGLCDRLGYAVLNEGSQP
jgi:hypothetical protein